MEQNKSQIETHNTHIQKHTNTNNQKKKTNIINSNALIKTDAHSQENDVDGTARVTASFASTITNINCNFPLLPNIHIQIHIHTDTEHTPHIPILRYLFLLFIWAVPIAHCKRENGYVPVVGFNSLSLLFTILKFSSLQ